MKAKKLLLGLGAATVIIGSTVSVIACSKSDEKSQIKNMTCTSGVDGDELIIKVRGKDLPNKHTDFRLSIKYKPEIKIELEDSIFLSGDMVTLKALDSKNSTWTTSDILDQTIIVEVDGFSATEATIIGSLPEEPETPVDPTPTPPENNRPENEIQISTINPIDVLPNLVSAQSGKDVYQILNPEINSSTLEGQGILNQFNKLNFNVWTPTSKEIEFGEFSFYSEKISNIISENNFMNEIKSNLTSSPLDSGYDFVVKKSYMISSDNSNESMPTNTLSPAKLKVLIQLTKNGQEVMGASTFVTLDNFVVNNTPSAINEAPASLIEWKEKINNITTYLKSITNNLPNELSRDNFSCYDWTLRQLMGVNNNQINIFSIIGTTTFGITSSNGGPGTITEIYSNNIFSLKVNSKTNEMYLVADDYYNYPFISKFIAKAQIRELLDLLNKFALEATNIAFDQNKPEWWYIDFYKLAQTSKNQKVLEYFDQLVNKLISIPTYKSRTLYTLKSSEIRTPKVTINENSVIKKSELEKFLNMPINEIESYLQQTPSNWKPFDDEYISYGINSIDLERNKIELFYWENNYNINNNSIFPLLNIDSLNVLSNKKYNNEHLSIMDIIDVKKDSTKRDEFGISYYDEYSEDVSISSIKYIKIDILTDEQYEKRFVSDGTYVLNTKNGCIVEYLGSKDITTLEIPSTIQGHEVKMIKQDLFRGFKIQSLILPKTLTSIGDSAFSSNQITSLTIPSDSSLTSIGDYAFSSNQITSLVFEGTSSVKIGENAFSWNNIDEVVLPYGSTYVSGTEFDNSFDENVVISFKPQM